MRLLVTAESGRILEATEDELRCYSCNEPVIMAPGKFYYFCEIMKTVICPYCMKHKEGVCQTRKEHTDYVIDRIKIIETK